MEIEEIEEEYKKEKEDAKLEFIKGMQNKGNTSELERVYKERLKLARDAYYRQTQKLLKNPNNFYKKESRKKETEESKLTRFKLEETNLKRSFFQELLLKLKINLFRIKIRIKNAFQTNISNSTRYSYFKSKKQGKKAIKATGKGVRYTIISILESLKALLKEILLLFKKLWDKIKKIPKIFAKKSKETDTKKENSKEKPSEKEEKTNSNQNK